MPNLISLITILPRISLSIADLSTRQTCSFPTLSYYQLALFYYWNWSLLIFFSFLFRLEQSVLLRSPAIFHGVQSDGIPVHTFIIYCLISFLSYRRPCHSAPFCSLSTQLHWANNPKVDPRGHSFRVLYRLCYLLGLGLLIWLGPEKMDYYSLPARIAAINLKITFHFSFFFFLHRMFMGQ